MNINKYFFDFSDFNGVARYATPNEAVSMLEDT